MSTENNRKTLVNVIQAVNVANITKETIDGDEHYIIPSTTLPDNVVMNGGLYPADEIEKGYKSLEGVPAPLSHPQINGKYTSALDVRAINQFHAGAYVRNVSRSNGIVNHETVVNIRVANQSEKGKELIDAIERGKPIHTSTGVFLNREELEEPMVANSGPSKGTEYNWIARNLVHDHNAILLNEKGAATPADGVGMMVNEDEEQQEFEVMFCNVTEDKPSWFNSLVEAVTNKLKGDKDDTKEVDPMKEKMIAALNAAGVTTEGLTDDQLFEKHGELIATNAVKQAEPKVQQITAEDVAKIVTDTIAANKAEEAKQAKSSLVDKVIANSDYTEEDKEMLLNTDERILKSFLPKPKASPIGVGAAFNNEDISDHDIDLNAMLEGK